MLMCGCVRVWLFVSDMRVCVLVRVCGCAPSMSGQYRPCFQVAFADFWFSISMPYVYHDAGIGSVYVPTAVLSVSQADCEHRAPPTASPGCHQRPHH